MSDQRKGCDLPAPREERRIGLSDDHVGLAALERLECRTNFISSLDLDANYGQSQFRCSQLCVPSLDGHDRIAGIVEYADPGATGHKLQRKVHLLAGQSIQTIE